MSRSLVGSSSTSTFAGPREQPRQQQPVALAARQRLAPATAPAPAETESAQIAVHVLRLPVDGDGVVAVADRCRRRSDRDRAARAAGRSRRSARWRRAAPRRVRLELADQQPQQRRLPGAVRSDQPDAIAAHHADREVATTGVVAERLGDVLGLEDHLAGALGHLRLQAHVAHLRRGARPAPSASPCSARTRPSSRVRRALMPCRSQASSSARRLSNFSWLHRFVRQPLLLLREERRVVAGPRRQPAAIELDDARRDALEEHAVVRDEDDGAVDSRRGTSRATSSSRCRGGWSARRGAAGQAAPTSARASSTRRRQPPDSVSRARRAEDPRRESDESTRCSRCQSSSRPRSPRPSDTTSNTGACRRAERPARAADAQPGLPPHACRPRRELAADDLQQRRLAGAVAADDADALARLDLQAGIVEQRQMAVGDRNAIEG